MSASIRETVSADSPSLSRICLLTAAAGESAEHLHAFPELPGLVYALPYNKLDSTFGFVLVDDHDSSVVGYILGSTDTNRFSEVAEREWWPALRVKYPNVDDPLRKPDDVRYISVMHSPHITPLDIASRFPAHIHIDILPSHQRKSYGKALMASAVKYLQDHGQSGLHVGLDPSNEPAKQFYSRIGFEKIDRKDGEWWGLDFDNFRG